MIKRPPWLRIRVLHGSIVATYLLGLLFLSTGCDPKKGELKAKPGDNVAEADALYRNYLTNDAQGAKRSIEEAVKLLTSSVGSGYGKGSLWLGYGRLFCIESEFGDSNRASLYFEKARYWYLVDKEMLGEAPSNIVEMLRSFSREQCRSNVLDFDRAFTKGVGAGYFN